MFGDGPIYATVAHEVGHAAQARFWYDDEAGATPSPYDKRFELQADCLAGATIAKAQQDGYLTLSADQVDTSKPEGFVSVVINGKQVALPYFAIKS